MKGKSSERMKQAVDELDYLVTFNRSISQAMTRTIQDLSEGVFISMANFTLACRDSYLEYLHADVKQDTLTALRTAPIHLHSLFPDQLITKAEEEICRSKVRRGVLLASLTDVKVAFTLMLPLSLCVQSDRLEPFSSDSQERQESDCTFSCRLLC